MATKFHVDLPRVGGECEHVASFDSRAEALAWIREHIGPCDDAGQISLLSSIDDGEEPELSDPSVKTYPVSLFWTMSAVVHVAAESLDEAIEIAQEDSDGDVFLQAQPGDYVDGSYEVNEDFTRECIQDEE